MERTSIVIQKLIENKGILPKSLYFGTFGSHSEEELDVFFIDTNPDKELFNTSRFESNFNSIKELFNISLEFPYTSFTSHLQKNICDIEGTLKLHVLFFPSIELIQHWELPSLVSYLYHKGRFINGDKEILQKYNQAYRSRKLHNNTCDVLTKELAFYSQLATNYYFYFKCNHIPFNKKEIFDKISYAIRFTLIEWFIENLEIEINIDFWDWGELVAYTKANYAEFNDLIDRIIHVRKNSNEVTDDLLSYLFKEYFELHNKIMAAHNTRYI